MEFSPPRFVVVDGRKIAYDEVAPPAPRGTILLLTGLAAKRQGWRRQLPAFGARYRVIAIDHRDIGDSDPVATPYAISDQADDAAAVLTALGIDRADVVGISMGGFIALELALRHPARVRRLVLTSTSAGGRTHVAPSLGLGLRLTFARLAGEPGATAKRIYARIMAPGYCASHPDEWEQIAALARYRPQQRASYQRQLRACQHHDVTDRLARIAIPTLVIHGDVDPLVPVGNGIALAAQIPGARLSRYAHTGHIPIVEQAERYNQEVLAFLDAPVP